jgi:hypothetical protein
MQLRLQKAPVQPRRRVGETLGVAVWGLIALSSSALAQTPQYPATSPYPPQGSYQAAPPNSGYPVNPPAVQAGPMLQPPPGYAMPPNGAAAALPPGYGPLPQTQINGAVPYAPPQGTVFPQGAMSPHGAIAPQPMPPNAYNPAYNPPPAGAAGAPYSPSVPPPQYQSVPQGPYTLPPPQGWNQPAAPQVQNWGYAPGQVPQNMQQPLPQPVPRSVVVGQPIQLPTTPPPGGATAPPEGVSAQAAAMPDTSKPFALSKITSPFAPPDRRYIPESERREMWYEKIAGWFRRR